MPILEDRNSYLIAIKKDIVQDIHKLKIKIVYEKLLALLI